jgi:hypothetical protein
MSEETPPKDVKSPAKTNIARQTRMLAQAFVVMFLLFGGGTMALGAWLVYLALPRRH